jgi:hypothetical protein
VNVGNVHRKKARNFFFREFLNINIVQFCSTGLVIHSAQRIDLDKMDYRTANH